MGGDGRVGLAEDADLVEPGWAGTTMLIPFVLLTYHSYTMLIKLNTWSCLKIRVQDKVTV